MRLLAWIRAHLRVIGIVAGVVVTLYILFGYLVAPRLIRGALNDARAGERIIGSSQKIRRAIEMALSVADSSTTVLLQGESGTGKELIASLIQFNSRRATRQFIKINCGAIPATLLETELFGHERGAFTDAREDRRGLFLEARFGDEYQSYVRSVRRWL